MHDQKSKLVFSWLLLFLAGAAYYWTSNILLSVLIAFIIAPLRKGLYSNESLFVAINENPVFGTIAIILFLGGLGRMAYNVNTIENYKLANEVDILTTFSPLLLLYLWRDIKLYRSYKH